MMDFVFFYCCFTFFIVFFFKVKEFFSFLVLKYFMLMVDLIFTC